MFIQLYINFDFDCIRVRYQLAILTINHILITMNVKYVNSICRYRSPVLLTHDHTFANWVKL